MLYADFYFRMKRRDAVCIAGWTTGRVSNPTLTIGELSLPAVAIRTHLRADLPAGATAFIMRFDLGGEILDIDNAKLRLADPVQSVAFPAASANLEALINTGMDEAIICLLMGMADGVFAVEEAASSVSLHKRAVAASRPYAELPGAAVAQDMAVHFSAPDRVLVTGWMGDDGSVQDLRQIAIVIDTDGIQPLALYPGALLRPDMAGAEVRSLKLGVTSGYVGAALLKQVPASGMVCLVGQVQGNMTIGTLRLVERKGPAELGRQFDHVRRNIVDAALAGEILANLLPTLPDYGAMEGARPVDRPAEIGGPAYVVAHDLDHWLARDVLRLLRTSDPELRRVGLVCESTSEGLIRAGAADRAEAGRKAPPVDLIAVNSPLATWAPEAQHLVVTSASLLFQIDVFPLLGRARADGLPAFCLVLTDRVEAGIAPISAKEGAEALLAGLPFLAQLDQTLIEPMILPQSLHLSQVAQMRWLLVALARAGSVTFLSASGLGFQPGRDPIPYETRQIELRAMRRTAEEITL